MTRIVFMLCVVMLGACIGIVGQHNANIQHAADWRRGWEAGYAAHEDLVREDNRKLMAAGLCAYASLACKEPKK